MSRGLLIALTLTAPTVWAQQAEPEGLRERIFEHVNGNLSQLPNYACTQSIDRYGRFGDATPWEAIDKVRLEVGLAGDREMYSWPGATEFEDRTLKELIGHGTVGTGHFAMLAKQVFYPNLALVTWRGEETREGKGAYHYEFSVPRRRSAYHLVTSGGEAVAGYQGSFWIDSQTLDLLRLEVEAVDIPDELELAAASNRINYGRVPIGGGQFLLPVDSELVMISATGEESRNLLTLSRCRQFVGESSLSFNTDVEADTPAQDIDLPSGLLLEMELAADIAFEQAAVGDPVRAILSKPVKQGDEILIPKGTLVQGHLVRLEKQTIPYEMYEVAVEFNRVKVEGKDVEFTATMHDAGPSSGLLREQKGINPTFQRRRSARMDILVRETPRGKGVMHWDSKKDRVPRGLKMKWIVD